MGVTADGFVKETLEDILEDIETSQRADISASLNLGPDSVLGQLNGIFADKLRELNDVAEAVYRAAYPDSAEGEALDAVASITGAQRLPASNSTVTVTCTGTPATLLSAGRILSVAVTGDRFVSIADATIGGGGTVAVEFESEETGPVAAPAATLTVIETPVAGWTSATNPLDAELGTDVETDQAFRIRRLALLSASGAATVEAIRAAILAVSGVTEAFVFENTSLITDVDGLPGKSFEVVVLGGTTNALVAEIFDVKPAGIQAYGGTTQAVTDSQGFSHTIGFSRPTDVPIYIEIAVETDPDVFGGGVEADGLDQLREALVLEGDSLGIGDDVIALKIQAAAFTVEGVVDVTTFLIDDVDPPVSSANLVVATRAVATFDTSRVDATVA